MDLEGFSKQVGLELDEFKYVTALIGMFPLAYVHRKMTNTEAKHWYSLITGFCLAWFMFGVQSLHYLVSSTLVMVMLRTLPPKNSPWIILGCLLAHLSYGHIYRQYWFYLEFGLDWTLPQMLIVVKLSNFSWSYHDGQLPAEELDRPERGEKKIVQFPSLLHYYSFVFFFPGFLTGPMTEFNHYMAFTERRTFADNGGKIPESWVSCLKKLSLCVGAYFANSLHKQYPDLYTTTDAFLEHSFLYRLAYIAFVCEIGTFKYYFAFSMGEIACNICGISYNGKDKNGNYLWDKILMMRLWEFKTTQNAKGLVAHWNVPTSIWLRQSIFMRIIKLVNNRSMAVFGTFFASAFWHGFYPGYYTFFISGALFEVCADKLKLNLRHYVVDEQGNSKPIKPVYDFLGWFLTYCTITYMTISFRLLAFTYAIAAWRSIYFVGHVIGISILVTFTLFPQRPPRAKKTN
eukprot:TRINITY_DN4084_c0_g1_i1.p1 TRINITY_DN4084_c0_g1~~TRINITY_DN4084_c0_g1_i1.p1  ORF type:complete len:469 (+),score=87.47 TRINITY_DN4084_c0_g1_i1:31-1407(+)